MNRIIVALSGGKASAWCGDWALKNYPKEDVVLYFNDVYWEHPDLYRFLGDLGRHWQHPITIDADGRSPERLFYAHHAIANNRMPFCSHELKANRLQAFYQGGDIIIFGITSYERKWKERANRIISKYQEVAAKTKKFPKIIFPLITNRVSKEDINIWLKSINIEEPYLYKLGFSHNNCSGGCVRAGKRQWALLYEKLPEVYAERERVEREVRAYLNKDVHILKDETLESLRKRIEVGMVIFKKPAAESADRQGALFDDDDFGEQECIGICDTQA